MAYYLRNGTLRKPFIVVEGFDPWELNEITGSTTDEQNIELGSITYKDFADSIYYNSKDEITPDALRNGYDLVYIDWYNSTEDIRANAELLIEIIREINRRKAEAGSSEKNVLMGQSMGGLIARYALKTMENEGESHEVSTYISHDSPHLGANVPVGAFYFVNQLFSLSNGYSEAVSLLYNDLSGIEETIYNIMNSTAARQMMCNYLSPFSGSIDNSVHQSWTDALEQLGFPEGDDGESIQNLSIVNGRAYDITSSLVDSKYLFYLDGYLKSSVFTDLMASVLSSGLGFAIWPVLFILELEELIPGSFLPGTSRFDIHTEVWPALSGRIGQKISVLRVKYTKKFFWISPKEYMLFSSTLNSPALSMYYDELPGSTFSIMDMSFSDSGILGSYDFPLQFADRFTFIPTASALAMNGNLTKSDYTRDYYLNPPEPQTETPFDAYYLSSLATGHTSINGTIFAWIADCLGSEISGPSHVVGEAEYSVSGHTDSVSWSTSDENIATIDGSGKLTATGNGVVEIEAKSYAFGKLFRKTKKVMVGFPDITIKTIFTSLKGYNFIINGIDADTKQLMADLASDGILSYEWSIIDSDGEMTTEVSSSDEFYYVPENDGAVTVAVRIIDTYGNKGTTYSDSFNLKVPFEFNYKYVTIDANRTVYFVRFDNTYERIPSQDFIVAVRDVANDDVKVPYITSAVNFYISRKNALVSNYVTGINDKSLSRWTFPLFDSQLFIGPLEDILLNGSSSFSSRIHDLELVLYNHEREKLMDIPFTIIDMSHSRPTITN